jgi:hypothetical protein
MKGTKLLSQETYSEHVWGVVIVEMGWEGRRS